MKLSDIPAKFAIPFANNADPSYIRDVPMSPTGTTGQASLQLGFPPANFQPAGAGGVPPFGQDFNGLLNKSTAWNRWQATGAFAPYDPAWQTLIGGYPQNSCVASLVTIGLVWMSIVDDNVTNPDTGGAGWISFFRILTQNTDLYVNGATGNDNNNGLSPATAKATIQAAIDTAWGYAPSQYTITIHVADGTYAGFVTPIWSGPSIVVTGNVASPSNVLISSGSSHAVFVQGPNVMQVKNLKVQTGTGGTPACGFVASSSATINTSNTVSGSCEGGVFLAAGGTINVGNHTFTGNAIALAWSRIGGVINLVVGATYTIANNLTISSTVRAEQSGSIFVSLPQPTWVLTGAVSGQRYFALLNGTINTQSAGSTYFPGNSAGTTQTGGQYA